MRKSAHLLTHLLGGIILFACVATAQAQTPKIASFSPWHGKPKDVITITGSNLGTTIKVWFNGKGAKYLTVLNDSTVNATIPTSATTGKIKIKTNYGSYTTSSDFVVDGTGGGGGGNDGGGGDTYVPPPPIDPPTGSMAGHPRLFIRQSDVSRLRNWANANNPIWNDILYLANNAKADMDAGKLDNDDGYGDGNGSHRPESYAELFAFLSVVHSEANAREDYANRAYTLFMKIMNEAVKGGMKGQPFRGPEFAISNRASWFGESFPLVVDWIYNKFTAQDKAIIRKVFLRWIQENLHANTTAQEHPQPLGLINDPKLIDTAHKVRWAANNYYSNHARQVGLMAMAMDAEDDIPTDATDPVAGTLRRYVGNAIGAWLYQIHHYEKTEGAGGISPEGLGYGELSMRAVAFLLLAMHTAGVDSPDTYGTQATMINSPYWHDEVANAYLNMLSPKAVIQESWVGPAYLPYLFSDDDHYKNKDYIRVLGPLAIYAMNTGDTQQYSKLRWMIDNLPPGGVTNRSAMITSAFDSSSISLPIIYFLAVDPNAAPTVDPRPALPPDHFAPGLGILLSRTDWSSDASWFTYKLSWNSIDHQGGDGNGIGFFRKGEWLTKNHTGYGANINSSDYQNTLSLQNPSNTTVSFWQVNSLRGSQWAYDPVGDPSPVTYSIKPDYTFAQGDATKLYNNSQANATDILHASRSTLFLKPDFVVVYDRAKSATAGRFKRFYLNTSAQAVINGKYATVTTPSKQRLYIHTLLPANATLNSAPMENTLTYEPAVYDPMGYRFWAEDLTLPNEVRFLHVLQGANPKVAKTASSLITSTSGTPFEGAVVGSVAILFKKDITTPFDTVVFRVPLGTTNTYVTGLAPLGGYTVKYKTETTKIRVTITTGGSLHADEGGVLKL